MPGPRGDAAARGLPGMVVVGEDTCGTRVMPGMVWEEGAAAAGTGLLGELPGNEGVTLRAGEVAAAVAAGMSYFCSCSR